MSNTKTGTPLLGYIVCQAMSDGQFIGGVLITDCNGLPVEFRHTEPTAPSRLQRILYGRVLESYMLNDVVMTALLNAVDAKPQIYIVSDQSYLPGANGFGPPAIWISEARSVPSQEIGTRHELSDEEFVLQLGPGTGPVRIKTVAGGNTPDTLTLHSSVSAVLLNAAKTMEIIEPLRRVEEALMLICDEQSNGRVIGKIAA